MVNDFKFEREDFFSLDWTIAKILYPLLKEFKKQNPGYPGLIRDKKEWDKILEQMIESFRIIVKCEGYYTDLTDKQAAKMHKGLDLFRTHYFQLWY